MALLVIAKEPVPGRVKTRLGAQVGMDASAALADAALADTLEAVAHTEVARRFLVLAGDPWPGIPANVEVLVQRGDGFDDRLANAFDDAWATTSADGPGLPMLLVGMDTPQLGPALLSGAAAMLVADRVDAGGQVDAVLGLAADGGWWALGLRRPDPTLLRGVPMSTDHTGVDTAARIAEAGLRCAGLPVLTDIDTVEDLRLVAGQAPKSRTAAWVRQHLV